MNLINVKLLEVGRRKLDWLLSVIGKFSMAMFCLCGVGLVHAEIKVTQDEPKILEFKLSTVEIKGKRWQQLGWRSEGSVRVKLFKNGKEIPGRIELDDGSVGWPGSMSGLRMRLRKDTAFKLVAENGVGSKTSKTIYFEVTVNNEKREPEGVETQVKHYPQIKSFYITPQTVKAGDRIKFHWDVKDSNKIRLYDELGEIDLRSEHQRNGGLMSFFSTTIDRTTKFRLVALDGEKKPVAKTFTVVVEKTINNKTCDVNGQLTGQWRQQVRETPNGSLSTWVVNVYVSERNVTRPFAKATVNKNGHYRISNLEHGKSYTLKPDWKASPEQVDFSCDDSKSDPVFNFNITGSPR